MRDKPEGKGGASCGELELGCGRHQHKFVVWTPDQVQCRLLPGIEPLEEQRRLRRVQPTQGRLEVLSIERSAASRGSAATRSEMEKNAGAEARNAVRIVSNECAPLVEFGVAIHGLMAHPIPQHLPVVDDLVVELGGNIIDTDRVLRELDVGKADLAGVFFRGHAKSLRQCEQTGGTAFVPLFFDGKVLGWTAAVKPCAPTESFMT